MQHIKLDEHAVFPSEAQLSSEADGMSYHSALRNSTGQQATQVSVWTLCGVCAGSVFVNAQSTCKPELFTFARRPNSKIMKAVSARMNAAWRMLSQKHCRQICRLHLVAKSERNAVHRTQMHHRRRSLDCTPTNHNCYHCHKVCLECGCTCLWTCQGLAQLREGAAAQLCVRACSCAREGWLLTPCVGPLLTLNPAEVGTVTHSCELRDTQLR